MSNAKIPDSKSSWKAIDIYLFSNGQQSSPPRKYHLMTDQLDWWKATLNHLARAQYGSVHSMIDLYTIEGKKVETPLQLSHNAAYVAVVPPDYFINAGYDKYLIKASRSWEKGQVRRNSNTVMIQPEGVQISVKSVSDEKVNETMEMKDESATIKTIIASVVDNQASILLKPERNTDKHVNNTLSPAKLSEKLNKKTIQPPKIVKKINSLTSPPSLRKPSLKRKDSVKINMAPTSDRPSTSDSNNNRVSSRNKLFKPIQRRRDSLPEAVLTKVEEVVNEIKSSSSLKVINQRRSSTKIAENESVEIKSMPYNINPNSEKPSISLNTYVPSSNTINRQGAEHGLFDENHQFNGDKFDKTEVDSKTAINLVSKTNAYTPLTDKDSFSVSDFSTANRSENVTVINKEGIAHLKLNIEIWNNPNDAHTNTASKRNSLIILKPEKGSQVDIEYKAEYNETLHNIITNEICGNEESYYKVIIVKSPNDENMDNTNHMAPVNNNNSKFLIFLPVLKLDDRCKRCECKEEQKGTNQTVINPEKKVASSISLHKEQTENTISHAEVTSINNCKENKVETNTLHDKNEMTIVKRKSVAIKEDEIIKPQFCKSIEPELVEEPESKAIEPVKMLVEEPESKASILAPVVLPQEPALIALCNECTGTLTSTANKPTQTEWCDVLIEARLQNDGCYLFYLPTLENLKNYKLC